MRALTWLLGCFVVLLGFEGRGPNPGGWTAVWISAAVLWFFVGCGIAVLALNKLVAAKMAVRRGGRMPGAFSSSGTAAEEPGDNG